MGGLGSGLYGGGGKKSKRSVESCRNLDIRILQKKKALALQSFVWEWRNENRDLTGSIGIKTLDDGLQLQYKFGEQPKKVKLDFAETAAGYGDVRWFLCPNCGDRRAILYMVDGSFACRVCHNLNYRSSQSSDDLEYYHWQLEKLCRQLKEEYDPIAIFPPERPARMHQKTYGKIYRQYRVLAHKRDKTFLKSAGAILSKCENFRR